MVSGRKPYIALESKLVIPQSNALSTRRHVRTFLAQRTYVATKHFFFYGQTQIFHDALYSVDGFIVAIYPSPRHIKQILQIDFGISGSGLTIDIAIWQAARNFKRIHLIFPIYGM